MKKFLLLILTAIVMCFTVSSFAINKIRWGIIYFYPPFAFSTKSGYINGFDMDLARALCVQLNAQCTFTALPLSDLFAKLNANQVDAILGAISITADREKQYNFTKPYYKSTMSFVALAKSNIDPNNLQGKKVGAVKDSTFAAYLSSKYGNNITLMTFVTNEALFNALSNRLVDVVLIDSPAGNYWVNYSTGLFKTIGTPQYLSVDQGYGVAVRKDNLPLLNALNSALTAVNANGSLDKIKQSYFAIPAKTP